MFYEVDPANGAVRFEFALQMSERLAFDSGALYSLLGQSLRRIDPATGTVVSTARLQTPSTPY